MLNNWIKIFLYQIKNNKFFTLLNVLGLSLGMAGLVFAILYWNDEHAYNAWNPEKDNVFQMSNILGEDMIWPTNIAPIGSYIKEIPEIEQICYTNNWYEDNIIEYNGNKEQLKVVDSQASFFSFFPFDFTSGSIKTALQDNTSIALSEEAALKLFGNEQALGKQVKYSGRNLVVRGIYRIPGKSSFAPQAVTNLIETRLKNDSDQWGNFSYALLIKLKDPNAINSVKEKIENLLTQHRSEKLAADEGMTIQEYLKKAGRSKIVLEPLATARLHSVVDGYPEGRGNYQLLLIMAGLSVLILILSVVNYVNLATANAVKRAKEVGVRKILGASKGNIVKQFVFETVIMAVFAILLALVIVELALPYYNDFLNKNLNIYGSQFYVQLILLFAIVVIVAGIFPALYVSNFETLKVLKGNFTRSKSGVWLRNGMLILQFTIASFFITGSYIVYQQVNYISNKDLGLHGEQVVELVYRQPEEEDTKLIFGRYQTIKQELKKIKGIRQVSAGAFTFAGNDNSSSSFSYKGGAAIQAQNMAVDFEMVNMMQIKMAQGRDLDEKFSSDTIDAVLINQVALKKMNEKEPVGKIIDWNDRRLKVVGVIKDFHLAGPQSEIPPMVFFHFKTINWMAYNLNKVYVKVNPENMEETIAKIDKFWTTKVDTEYPLSYSFVDKNYARTYQTYVKQRNLFSFLNVMVIAIALFGLFALASYSIQRKMKDIAIRKTLGADTKVLLLSLSKQYIIFCVTGFLIAALPAWLLLDKWLDNFAFRVNISPVPLIIGFAIILVLTLIVVLSRAYMATRVNVLKYLKYE